MIRILFVCLGNICRSPMAEFVMRDMVKKAGLTDKIAVESAATSWEEEGNPVHRGTVKVLADMGISCKEKRARRMEKADYGKFDLLIGMERRNIANMQRISGGDPDGKMHCLLDFSDQPRDIADPWYTGNFDATKRDVIEGCEALLRHLMHN